MKSMTAAEQVMNESRGSSPDFKAIAESIVNKFPSLIMTVQLLVMQQMLTILYFHMPPTY